MINKWLSILVLACMFTLAACGNSNEAQHHEEHESGDIQEETASAHVLPSFLDGQSEQVRLVYQLAGQATDVLQWMPCYCGCGESVGHRSNMNCFIREVRADGSVVWDDHGTRCGVCLQIAFESVKLVKDGKTLKEVREYIDEKYKEGYGDPTKTPFPA